MTEATTTPTTPTPLNWRELLIFVLALAAGISLLPLIGGSVLWTRPFWLDERCCTLYNVSEASNPIQVIKNVTRGDIAPPLLHLIVWSATRITGFSTPAVRSISLVCVCLAFVFVFAALRRRFGSASSAAGVAALATHMLVVEHAFEIRLYGVWLMCAAGYAWSLGLDPDRAYSRRRDAAVAVFSVLVCTIHWFGVISLGIMALAAVASRGRQWREGVRLVAPSVAGLIVLLACVPMLFIQLELGGSSIYWIPPLSFQQVAQMAWIFVFGVPPVLAVILLLRDRLSASPRAPARVILLDPSLDALSALVLMPVALIVMSAVLKPVVWPRYAIVAVLSWAPVVALAVESLGRIGRGAVLTLFLLLVYHTAEREVRSKRNFSSAIDAYTSDLAQAKRANIPIVFQNYFIMYPVDGASRRQSVARFLDLPDSSIASLARMPEWQRKLLVRDRNMVRVHEGTFGFPVPMTQARLDSTPSFYLIAADRALPVGYQDAIAFGKVVFPRHQAVRRSPLVTIFQRTR